MKSFKVRISHLSSRVTESQLQDTFRKCSGIVGISLKRHKATMVSLFQRRDSNPRNSTMQKKLTRQFRNSTGEIISEKIEGKYIKVRITGDRSRSVSSDDKDKSYDNYREPRRDRDSGRDRDREGHNQDISCFICHEKGHKSAYQTVSMQQKR